MGEGVIGGFTLNTFLSRAAALFLLARALPWTLLLVTPFGASAAAPLSVGDEIVLRSDSPRGIPLHREARTSRFGYADAGSAAVITEIANEGRWLRIDLSGPSAWILAEYAEPTTPALDSGDAEEADEIESPKLLDANCNGANERLLRKQFFLVCFNVDWRIPAWVAYALSPGRVEGKGDRNKSRWLPDEDLTTALQAGDADYAGSGYDKGHMAPAEDFTRSQEAVDATHVYSNAAPQTGSMNRGAWRSLEMRVRDAVDERGPVWVITGNLFLDANGSPSRPTERVQERIAIPTHCYKAILLKEDADWFAYGFLMPNKFKKLGSPLQYQKSIDDLEALMPGRNLFAALPDSVERRIEAEQPPFDN